MKICGAIAEYNPFHHGHAHHLRMARDLSRCDALVVCMAGSFSQRGDAMLLDKWIRTAMALRHGADVVVELPALFALRPAEWFARGGVLTLANAGIDALSFGCETEDVGLLTRAAALMDHEDEALSAAIRQGLSQGKTHARARGEAVSQRLGVPPQALSQPNTALGMEYMRAIMGLGRPIDVHVVPRMGDYHGADLGEYASASAIRAGLSGGGDISAALPPDCLSDLMRLHSIGAAADMRRLDNVLLWTLRRMGAEALARVADVGEGLENRIIKAAYAADSRDALISAVKSKRYTHARISRILTCAMLGLTGELCAEHTAPEYVRVLGFRRDAAPVLHELKRRCTLPLVTRPVQLKGNAMFDLECAATDLWALSTGHLDYRAAGQEFTRNMVIGELSYAL